jgi:hypothetical protein
MIRSIVVACALLLAATPAAADDSPLTPWLGTWKGKVSARGCADEVSRKVELEVEQTREGGMRSNGDLLLEGLGDLDWTVSGKKLTLAREGLTGSLVRSKKSASLKLRTAAGCSISATLKRTKAIAPVTVPASITGLPGCDAYVDAMQSYMRCDKVPQSARDAANQGLAAMMSGWHEMKNMPPEAQKAAEDACLQAVDALKQGAEAMGCTL